MPSYVRVIQPHQLGELPDQLAKRVQSAQRETLRDFGEDWQKKLINESDRIIGRESEYGASWMFEVVGQKVVRLWNNAWHAIFVERGRKPGKMPPLDAIRAWCAQELGRPELAFVIARAIGRRGIRARPNMEAETTQQAMRRDFVARCVDLWETALRKAAGH